MGPQCKKIKILNIAYYLIIFQALNEDSSKLYNLKRTVKIPPLIKVSRTLRINCISTINYAVFQQTDKTTLGSTTFDFKYYSQMSIILRAKSASLSLNCHFDDDKRDEDYGNSSGIDSRVKDRRKEEATRLYMTDYSSLCLHHAEDTNNRSVLLPQGKLSLFPIQLATLLINKGTTFSYRPRHSSLGQSLPGVVSSDIRWKCDFYSLFRLLISYPASGEKCRIPTGTNYHDRSSS